MAILCFDNCAVDRGLALLFVCDILAIGRGIDRIGEAEIEAV